MKRYILRLWKHRAVRLQRRYLSLLLSLSLLLLLASCGRADRLADRFEAEQATPAADATAATPQSTALPPAGTTVLADGQLVAARPILSLSFRTSGQLAALAVEPGDAVEAGALIATLDDASLQDSVTSAQLQVASAENNLAQAELSLNQLLAWAPDETSVALAEANLASAEAALERAEAQDAVAGNNLTSARVNLSQTERGLANAQEAYDTAHDPARDWELNDPFRSQRLEAERDATTRNLQQAREALEVARAQYSLAAAGINDDTALSAAGSVLSARQALEQAQRGPTEDEIAAARLRMEQAAINLEQSEFSLQQAEEALANAQLHAPWQATVLTVEVAEGATIGAGTPVVTLLDTESLQFHTSNLTERDLAVINTGQPAVVTLKSYPNEALAATVARVAPRATGNLGDAAIFTVILELEATALPLRPGMTGRVEIINPG